MTYVLKKKHSSKSNYGSKRPLSAVKYIVIHWTGNDGDSDEGNANYFASGSRGASAHSFVDNDSVTISVPATYVAWSVGVDYQDQASPLASKGRKFAGKATNANTFNIELCDVKKDGKHAFTDETLTNAANYTRKQMKRFGIDVKNVIRHFDVTGKICPYPFVVDENAWNLFKTALQSTVKTTKAGVKLREKPLPLSKTKSTGELKKGKKCIIEKIQYEGGVPYGYLKKRQKWIALVNTK